MWNLGAAICSLPDGYGGEVRLFISKSLGIYIFPIYIFPSQFKLSSVFSFYSHISQGDWNRKCPLKLLFLKKSVSFPPPLKILFTL